MHRLLLLAALSMAAWQSTAQCTRLAGTVADANTCELLPGANVQLVSSKVATSTNTQGWFELPYTSPDSLQVSFIGYQSIKLLPGDSCTLTLQLSPAMTNLDEVVIKSERLIAEEFTIRKLSKLSIYTNPSAKADPLLAVNASPSATPLDESANISLRGSSPAETGIFFNNVPLYDAVRYTQLNGIGTFSIFNTALINQVQVYPGNPPLEFGNTTSGLIALYTDEVVPEQPTNTLSLSLASLGLYTQRRLTKQSSLTAFSNVQPSAAFRWVNPRATERLKQFNSADAGLHYFARAGTRTAVKVFNYTNTESFKFLSFHPTDTGDFRQRKFRNYTVANVRHRLGKGELSFNQGFSFSRTDFSLSTLDVKIFQYHVFSSFNYQYFATQGEVKTGISYERRSSRFDGVFPQYEFARGEEFPTASFASNQSVNTPEVYVYGKRYLGSSWIVGGGLRKNWSLNGQPDFFSTQVNVAYKPSKYWNVVLSAGRYNRNTLNPYGEPALLHIRTDQYSADVNYKRTKLETSAAVFYKRGQQIHTETQVKGIELYARYRFDQHVKTEMSFSSLRATERTEQGTTASPYNIGYFWRGNVEYKWSGTWTATVAFLFRQGSYWTPVINASPHATLPVYEPLYGTQQRLPRYFLLDVSVSKLMVIGSKYTGVAFAGLSNVPNVRNVQGYTYNFNYTEKYEELFSRRVLYFGVVVNF